MTSVDLAVSAFRQETCEAADEDELTLQGILVRVQHRRQYRRLYLAIALSLAGSASAAFIGASWMTHGHSTQRRSPEPTLALKEETTMQAVHDLPDSATGTQVTAPQGRVSTGSKSPRRRAEPDPFAAEDELFAQAQRVHVDAPGSVEDLEEWEGYLRQYPHGRFEPEARYRRAVSLAALQRWDDARLAFSLFAQEVFGDYRRQESAAWLRSLPEP